MPFPVLPEMTLPSPVPAPPISVLAAVLSMRMPCWFGTAAVPAALVPM